MAKTRTLLACTACGRPTDRWTGRCAACGAWGSIEEHPAAALSGAAPGRVPGGAPAVVLPLEG
ncbi:MAG TPA: DNA repair protein RadA, partial [Actinomycetota bacterium]|nr:DNA repair protein RadA [Actinomycetota bacterium]